MTIPRRLSEPVRAPVRQLISHYTGFFEDLIHAVKSELVEKIELIDDKVTDLDSTVATDSAAVRDQLAVHTASMQSVKAELAALRDAQQGRDREVNERLETLAAHGGVDRLIGAPLSAIDGRTGAFLNHATSWKGPLSAAGLFVNHPFWVEWTEGSARIAAMNERIIEQPFVFGALADLAPGSTILDVGGGESIVAVALASLGHRVTVIEPRGYPFEHPNLTVHAGSLESFEAAGAAPEGGFDAVVALSTIEHLGLGHYDGEPPPQPDGDVAAMAQIGRLLSPEGRLVLTAPHGPARVTDVERIYDRAGLERLLAGWHVERLSIGRRVDDTTWTITDLGLDAAPTRAGDGEGQGEDRVVMLVASRPVGADQSS